MTLPVGAASTHAFPRAANKDYVYAQKKLVELQQKGVVFLKPMPDKAFHASQLPPFAYSQMLMSAEFWQLVTSPKVLLVQTDAWSTSI